MLAALVANHPAAPPHTCRDLARACAPHSPAGPHAQVALHLLARPDLPRDLRDELIAAGGDSWWAHLTSQPWMTPAAALDLLQSHDIRDGLAVAVQRIPDPDGTLGRKVLDSAPTPAMLTIALRAARHTPTRIALARTLANGPAQPLPTEPPRLADLRKMSEFGLHVFTEPEPAGWASLNRWLRGHPQFSAAAVTDTAFGRAHAQAQLPEVGTYAWFASWRVSDDERLAHLDSTSPAHVWRRAALTAAECSSDLATTCLRLHRRDPLVLNALVHNQQIPPNLRAAAVTALETSGRGNFRDLSYLFHLVQEGDPAATLAYSSRPIEAMEELLTTTRTDAATFTAALTNITAAMALSSNYARSKLLFGLWALTHPAASPQQRRRGAEWADAEPLTAHLEARIEAGDLAGAGESIPMPFLRKADSRVAGLTALVNAYLGQALPTFPTGAGAALVALAPTFTGTVGELFAVARTLTSQPR